jgi:hypothetical protein
MYKRFAKLTEDDVEKVMREKSVVIRKVANDKGSVKMVYKPWEENLIVTYKSKDLVVHEVFRGQSMEDACNAFNITMFRFKLLDMDSLDEYDLNFPYSVE